MNSTAQTGIPGCLPGDAEVRKMRVSLSSMVAVFLIFVVPAGSMYAQAPAENGRLGSTASNLDGSAIAVKYSKGLMSVSVKDADIGQLFKVIGEKTGIQVNLDPAIGGKVSAEFNDLSLEAGLQRILAAIGEKNLAVEYLRTSGEKTDSFKAERISILRNAAIKEPSEAEILAAVKKRDLEYRELFEKMDKEKNKIVRALKEYVDPKTDADKKNKLRTYLRQTSIHEPEDKKLLMSASLDPQYSDLRSELDMALMHAIQDHPEESDKEYILSRWREKRPQGWLLYAMLKVWDPRYVPYLLRAVSRSGDIYCIEILGRAKVKEAVPDLELALRHKNADTRREAYYALLSITGKKYEYISVLEEPKIPAGK
jgi:hypothetical protein